MRTGLYSSQNTTFSLPVLTSGLPSTVFATTGASGHVRFPVFGLRALGSQGTPTSTTSPSTSSKVTTLDVSDSTRPLSTIDRTRPTTETSSSTGSVTGVTTSPNGVVSVDVTTTEGCWTPQGFRPLNDPTVTATNVTPFLGEGRTTFLKCHLSQSKIRQKIKSRRTGRRPSLPLCNRSVWSY